MIIFDPSNLKVYFLQADIASSVGDLVLLYENINYVIESAYIDSGPTETIDGQEVALFYMAGATSTLNYGSGQTFGDGSANTFGIILSSLRTTHTCLTTTSTGSTTITQQ